MGILCFELDLSELDFSKKTLQIEAEFLVPILEFSSCVDNTKIVNLEIKTTASHVLGSSPK